jgi:glycine cleavage system aminomethyltransferase T
VVLDVKSYREIYALFEAALDRFVGLGKNDFIDRDAASAKRKAARCAASA